MIVERGVIPALLAQYKAAAKSGGVVSGPEAAQILNDGILMIRSEFVGGDSEKGLAAQRKALATTARAAERNWTFTGPAKTAQVKALGPDLDGKGGTMAVMEKAIRNQVRGQPDTSNW